MNKLIENCLFLKNREHFAILRTKVSDFRNSYIGETIVRDSIFDVIQNYVKSKKYEIKLLKFPIDDSELWAFTCVKDGIIFVTINTALPYNNQIFAAAHELYHIYKYIEDSQEEYIERGSILTKKDFDEEDVSEEDREANAFAALILAPKEQIEKQVQLTGREFTDSDLFDLIHFMDCFAMPYKAMVLKLFECGRYNENVANLLLESESRKVIEEAYIHDCGTRWLKPTYENNLESLKALVELNLKSNNITESRAKDDLSFLEVLEEKFKTKRQ